MPTLDELYNQTIEEQRNYLAKLQDAFNKHCDKITAEAKKKLAEIPEILRGYMAGRTYIK